ncbi:nitrite/sulfite reductase [Streptomyces durmitorensis]|uniref:Precorrin-3B synthase n=1 Tax=Streptomyces durmitorensis TaxID=319947 RepID=A0ABY4PKN5_9ACTN|nr:precorrin-3B synthase [Streptomyces durmitorensis]UQT53962.1 precorrin-3B synthase [Streptomyces durmitorensis]
MLAAMPPSVPSPPLSGDESARGRGDACPGTLRLHRADDGALARVRIPGGVLSAGQADVLRDAAERLGDGELHLTSRGNVQVRGLPAHCGGELAYLLGESGLLPSERHERVRNVVASPLAGLDGRGEADIRPWLSALDELVCASDRAAALSGRFLFALDDGRGDVGALGGDVTLTARDADEALLRIGPSHDAVLMTAAQAPRAALIAAETFLEQAPDAGAWRVTDLPGGIGPLLDAVLHRLRQAGLQVTRTTAPLPQDPGGPALGVVSGPHRTAALSLGLPLGSVSAPQWQTLADTARHHGSGELRLTPWRGVILPGVERTAAAQLLEELGAAGLITGPDSPWTGVGACIGRPGCAKALDDVRATAKAASGPGGALPVYWSGCERRCGHPHGEWIDVVATPDGHQISRVRGEKRDTPATVPGSPGALAAAVAAARG